MLQAHAVSLEMHLAGLQRAAELAPTSWSDTGHDDTRRSEVVQQLLTPVGAQVHAVSLELHLAGLQQAAELAAIAQPWTEAHLKDLAALLRGLGMAYLGQLLRNPACAAVSQLQVWGLAS